VDNLITPAGGGNYTSQRVLTLVNDGNTAISNITFTETIAGTAAKATRSVVTAGGLGVLCTFTGLATDPTYDLNCSLALAADNGTVGDNSTTGPADGDTAIITITVGGPGAAGATIVYNAVTPVCVLPGACTNNVVSPSNSDGGPTIIPADTDTIQADLNDSVCSNAAQTTCIGNAVTFPLGGSPEDLSVAGGWAAQNVYVVDNNGPGPITFPPCPPTPCAVTLTGDIGAGSTAVYSGGVPIVGTALQVSVVQNNPSVAPHSPWFCTTNIVAVPWTWQCQGDLGSGSTGQLDDRAAVIVQVTGTSGATGQTIIYDAAAPACAGSPGACTDAAVSPANSDGSDLTPGAPPPLSWLQSIDTLTP